MIITIIVYLNINHIVGIGLKAIALKDICIIIIHSQESLHGNYHKELKEVVVVDQTGIAILILILTLILILILCRLSRHNTGLSRKESGLLTYQEQDEADDDNSLADYNWIQQSNSSDNYNQYEGYSDPNTNHINTQNTTNNVVSTITNTNTNTNTNTTKPQSPINKPSSPAPTTVKPNEKKRKDSYFSFLGNHYQY